MARTSGRHRISRRTKIATAGLGLALAIGGIVVVTTTGDPGQARADLADKSFFVDITQVKANVNPPKEQGDASTGTFTVDCGVNENGHFNPDNFIAQPGVKNGAQHLHDYVGNLTTDADSNNQSLQKGGTTCKNGDKSAYFWPVIRIEKEEGEAEEGDAENGQQNNQNGQNQGQQQNQQQNQQQQQQNQQRDKQNQNNQDGQAQNQQNEQGADQQQGQNRRNNLVQGQLAQNQDRDRQDQDGQRNRNQQQNQQDNAQQQDNQQQGQNRQRGNQNQDNQNQQQNNDNQQNNNDDQNNNQGNNQNEQGQQQELPGVNDQNELAGNDGEIQRPASAELTFRGSPVGDVVAMPKFLRILYGDAKVSTNGPKNARDSWTCAGFEDKVLINKYPICPGGAAVKRIHDFPSCWDGKNIDSANHRDHIVFPQENGQCKNGFKAVPQLRITLTYNIPADVQQNGQYKVDSFPEEEHNPFSDHDDFANVMSNDIMNRVVNCINEGKTCKE